jgi:hypothetical protein
MASEKFSLIILDNPTQGQRNAVHGRVRKATGSWWHGYDDIWIVQSGLTAAQWIDQLQGFFKSGPASFLVLGLPETDQTRSWAYFGPNPNERASWLHKYYTKR